jgi:hypothetical protein
VSRQQALGSARRAEASRLVALGRLELGRYPTAAVAYARQSLEVNDTHEARLLALEALWRGPTARVLALPARDDVCRQRTAPAAVARRRRPISPPGRREWTANQAAESIAR